MYGKVFYSSLNKTKKIAITFDDGPQTPYTQKILSILKKCRIKATFFLLGKNVEQHPDIAKRILREGHAIGNHTYNHLPLNLLSKREIIHQLIRAESIFDRILGIKTSLLRPPYGSYNKKLISLAKELGYRVIMWSVCPRDWERPGKDIITKRFLGKIKGGAIILLHDGAGAKKETRSQTVEALPIIIKKIKQKGFIPVTIPELLNDL